MFTTPMIPMTTTTMAVTMLTIIIKGQAPMKHSSHKSIPSIERKPTRKFKPLVNATHLQALVFAEPHELIFKAQILPVILELDSPEFKQLTLMITPSQASLKCGQETCSMPFSLGKHRWLRVILGQAKRAELRSSYGDSSIDKNQVFRTMQSLKAAHGEELHNVHHFYCMPLLRLMKAKIEKKDKSVETAGKSSIGSFIKTRLSERNPVRASLVPFRPKHEVSSTHAELSRNTISKTFETLDRRDSTTVHSELRKGASTIEAGRFLHRQCPSQLKESNTSTSIGGEPDIKFSRKMRKIKEITENKTTKSMKHPLSDGSCGLFPSSRPKPRFYQQFNISQEEIDLKRRKFDSQFICVKQSVSQTTKDIAPDRNESEVAEEITKMENSQTLNGLDDTLEKGINGQGQLVDESGTLYESVYE